jgi:hypothetical protein
MYSKNFTLIVFLLSFVSMSNAQIRGINYKMQFNPATNLFDCYLIVKEGKTSKLTERAQFNAQYTIIVPSGSQVKVAKTYMPIENNQTYKGTTPAKWTLSNKIIKPLSDPFNDYISIVPNLTPVSFYNDLKQGDEIKLFSLSVSPISDCGASVRLFDKKEDLSSRAIGMEGGDFSNGFTIGGVKQKYLANQSVEIPSLKVIDQLNKNTKNGIHLNLQLSASAENVAVEWFGPNGYYAKGNDIKISKPSQENYGIYQAVVTDSRGCREERTIDIPNPNTELNTDKFTPTNTASNNNVGTVNKKVKLQDQDVSVYPNPASSLFNVHISAYLGASLKMDISDNTGRLVKSNLVNTNMDQNTFEGSYNIADLSPGIYSLNINLDGIDSSHRLIVIK